jgi:hypothetical protein
MDDVPHRVPTIHHRLSAVTSSPSLMRASAEPFTPTLLDQQQLILTRDTSTRYLLLPPPRTRRMATPCPTATAFLPRTQQSRPAATREPACLRLDTLVPPRTNRWSTPRPPSNRPRYGRTFHRSTTSSRRTDPESSKSTMESHRRPQRSSSPRRRSHPHRPTRPHHRIHQPRHLCQ